MPKAIDISIEGNTTFLLKGPAGFGKTIALASFAIDGPIYLAYFDKKNAIELKSFYSSFGEIGRRILSNIEYDLYSAVNANEYLNKLMELALDCRYFAVCTDSITNLTSAAVNWSLGFRENKKNKNKDKIMPDFDEYKVETSIVTQALDICKKLPCHVIFTAHPIPGIKVEGSGPSMRVTKTNPIVTYGSKVAGIFPGNFSEIYHFTKTSGWDATSGKSTTKYAFSCDAIGDDYAKSNLGLTGEYDFTNKLFYEVWKGIAKKRKEDIDAALNAQPAPFNPAQILNLNPLNQPIVEHKKWNSEKGVYE